MGSMTIRNLDDDLKARLRVRAANHGHSMEAEVRQILRDALEGGNPSPRSLVEGIRSRVTPLGGIELDIPDRDPVSEPLKL